MNILERIRAALTGGTTLERARAAVAALEAETARLEAREAELRAQALTTAGAVVDGGGGDFMASAASVEAVGRELRMTRMLAEGARARLRDAETEAAAAAERDAWRVAAEHRDSLVEAARRVDRLVVALAAELLALAVALGEFWKVLPNRQGAAVLARYVIWRRVVDGICRATNGAFGDASRSPSELDGRGVADEVERFVDWLIPSRKEK